MPMAGFDGDGFILCELRSRPSGSSQMTGWSAGNPLSCRISATFIVGLSHGYSWPSMFTKNFWPAFGLSFGSRGSLGLQLHS